jgi:hypothetical protein
MAEKNCPAGPKTPGEKKNYVSWDRAGASKRQRGTKGSRLVEMKPKFAKRPGDKVIEGENNTSIILGRDRPAWRRPDGGVEDLSRGGPLEYKDLHSGYGDEMCAGSIDIVVGRMAPFPFNEFPSEAQPGQRQIDVGPQFNTEFSKKLTTLCLANCAKTGPKRPAFTMDAARIYVSQKTDADLNFKIAATPPGKNVIGRRSAIVSKADQIRLYGRENIKIVTGGPGTEERINSQGGSIAQQGGIHLMAGNGKHPNGSSNIQEPIPKGDRLIIALQKLAKILDQLNGTVTKFIVDQTTFNTAVAAHVHVVAPGTVAVWDIVTACTGTYTFPAALQCGFDLASQKANLANWQLNHLKRSGKSYINSKYNTVN